MISLLYELTLIELISNVWIEQSSNVITWQLAKIIVVYIIYAKIENIWYENYNFLVNLVVFADVRMC